LLDKFVGITGAFLERKKWSFMKRNIYFQVKHAFPSDLLPPRTVLLFVFDISNEKSFQEAVQLQKTSTSAKGVLASALIGNKLDFEFWRAVSVSQGMKAAADAGIPYVEVSAHTGKHIEVLTDAILGHVFYNVAIGSMRRGDLTDARILTPLCTALDDALAPPEERKHRRRRRELRRACTRSLIDLSATHISASSESENAQHLLLDNDALTWHSNGEIGAHWIQIEIPERVIFVKLEIFTKDFGNYSPKTVRILCDGVVVKESMELSKRAEWATLLTAAEAERAGVSHCGTVRVHVKECHDGGCNTRMAAVRVTGVTDEALSSAQSEAEKRALRDAEGKGYAQELVVSGCSGRFAGRVNGSYRLTGQRCGDAPRYQNRIDGEILMEYCSDRWQFQRSDRRGTLTNSFAFLLCPPGVFPEKANGIWQVLIPFQAQQNIVVHNFTDRESSVSLNVRLPTPDVKTALQVDSAPNKKISEEITEAALALAETHGYARTLFVSGASGLYAHIVNGVYELKNEKSGGMLRYQNSLDENTWLEHCSDRWQIQSALRSGVSSGSYAFVLKGLTLFPESTTEPWMVLQSANLERYDAVPLVTVSSSPPLIAEPHVDPVALIVDPPPAPTPLRLKSDSLTVSSNADRKSNLLTDKSHDSCWESDGSQGTHWIQISLPGGTSFSELQIFTKDFGNYSPKTVRISCDGVVVKESMELSKRAEWVTLLTAAEAERAGVSHCGTVRVHVKECHDGGCNTRMAAVRVTGGTSAPSSSIKTPVPTSAEISNKLNKYLKMHKCDVPDGAVRLAMRQDGYDSADIEDFFLRIAAAAPPAPPLNKRDEILVKILKIVCGVNRMRFKNGPIRMSQIHEEYGSIFPLSKPLKVELAELEISNVCDWLTLIIDEWDEISGDDSGKLSVKTRLLLHGHSFRELQYLDRDRPLELGAISTGIPRELLVTGATGKFAAVVNGTYDLAFPSSVSSTAAEYRRQRTPADAVDAVDTWFECCNGRWQIQPTAQRGSTTAAFACASVTTKRSPDTLPPGSWLADALTPDPTMIVQTTDGILQQSLRLNATRVSRTFTGKYLFTKKQEDKSFQGIFEVIVVV
jgi:hypothetical protein